MVAFKAPAKEILAAAPTLPYKQFLLFGDSITQGAFDQNKGFALGAQLAHDYMRRLDVVDRGLSGYNTDQALAIIEYIFPPPTTAKIDYMTLFFGANDSCHLGGVSHQHVPLQTYRENLLAILSHPLLLAHNPRIVIITTPPVDEYQLAEETRSDGRVDRGRSAEKARAYAEAGKAVGEALRAEGREVVVCDLWSALMARTGWSGEGVLPGSLKTDKNPAFAELLSDGLHFNPPAYRVLYDELRQTLEQTWPDSHPERLEKHFPDWNSWF
ncbi:hypothetical protein VE01_08367 [Pseudogymnoascus verrucosus]|uniref:SGNH hydrolase-type esterase domain-containing protein n=1 Tax=Pseudogymnoascus verrucosus TaxID=342668 RepID=A0A1B8GCJ3_9PEZI|nr:uncharacterized protein VE01_08367 [Pseudogymnoascus verrucosus]OBT93558.1 hypothetical protein VE01_08367 [Pseudogymnoascus verrucosus]